MFKHYYLKEKKLSPTSQKEDKLSQILLLTNLGTTLTHHLHIFVSFSISLVPLYFVQDFLIILCLMLNMNC
jgi:hypothetical protein